MAHSPYRRAIDRAHRAALTDGRAHLAALRDAERAVADAEHAESVAYEQHLAAITEPDLERARDAWGATLRTVDDTRTALADLRALHTA